MADRLRIKVRMAGERSSMGHVANMAIPQAHLLASNGVEATMPVLKMDGGMATIKDLQKTPVDKDGAAAIRVVLRKDSGMATIKDLPKTLVDKDKDGAAAIRVVPRERAGETGTELEIRAVAETATTAVASMVRPGSATATIGGLATQTMAIMVAAEAHLRSTPTMGTAGPTLLRILAKIPEVLVTTATHRAICREAGHQHRVACQAEEVQRTATAMLLGVLVNGLATTPRLASLTGAMILVETGKEVKEALRKIIP